MDERIEIKAQVAGSIPPLTEIEQQELGNSQIGRLVAIQRRNLRTIDALNDDEDIAMNNGGLTRVEMFKLAGHSLVIMMGRRAIAIHRSKRTTQGQSKVSTATTAK